jgi:RecB family exonuclease
MAARELPRRLAATGDAVAASAFSVRELAAALAEPALLLRGHEPWNPGHDLQRARHLLDTGGADALGLPEAMPRAPVAGALARTLSDLRRAGVPPAQLAALAATRSSPGDAHRLLTLAALYRRFHDSLEGRFADAAALLRTAAERLGEAAWLGQADIVVVGDPELDPLEESFLAALARRWPVRWLSEERPPSLPRSPMAASFRALGVAPMGWSTTPLAPIAPPVPPPGLARLRQALFEPPRGADASDPSVELLTAPGEAAEVRAIVRRMIAEAGRGVPFEEMGVILPRADHYAPLFTDLLGRVGIPHRLHPSVPLRVGRCARSVLLLFRCRGLVRPSVMEFLTFARIPFASFLGRDDLARPALWDAISRDAQIVSGHDRWFTGLTHFAQEERKAAEADLNPERANRRRLRADAADALLRVVEVLSQTLDGLDGEASWPEWSAHLKQILDLWIAPETGKEEERAKVARVVADLATLGASSGTVHWREVEGVVERRFEDDRLPVEPVRSGAVHIGALDAMAGVPFRFVAIPGLVEGGYPGVFRADPFLLDAEREALAGGRPTPPESARSSKRKAGGPAQLDLFREEAPPESASPETTTAGRLPTAQDRLLETRRVFHRAISQATARLVLSYPRADPRTGRERLPSLFFVAAAQALAGRVLGASDLGRRVGEDGLREIPLDLAVDLSERDRARVQRGGEEAAREIAGGSLFFRSSRLAAKARWSPRLTAYDGFLAPLPPEILARLELTSEKGTVSASRLADYGKCGFLYLLRHVLRLEPALEPEERRKLQPLERGSAFHDVAERFLRERRDRGELPLTDAPATDARLLEMCDEALDRLVEGSPPRFTLLWERERARFRETALTWLARERAGAGRSLPRHFEVAFGLPQPAVPGEAFSPDPVLVDLGDGRRLRVVGRIDRIDEREDKSLVLRDYKTGRAPKKDDGNLFRGGQQLQIPFYILAAAQLFPDQPVREAFLDYVDGGRQVAFDPADAGSERFLNLLRNLADTVAEGAFPQEPAACDFCDYKVVCGPKGLLERRRGYKITDRRLQRYLRLRDL